TVQWIANGHLLAISGVRYRDEIVDGRSTSAPTDFESVFDENADGTFYDEDYGQARWSAANSLMLYRDHRQKDASCQGDVMKANSKKGDCAFLSKWQSRIQDYAWSEDGRKIIFTYINDDKKSGGLCFVDAQSRAIQCPPERKVKGGILQSSYR